MQEDDAGQGGDNQTYEEVEQSEEDGYDDQESAMI